MYEEHYNALKQIAEHNLEVLRTKNWKDFIGYGISEAMHIECDVIAYTERYESFLKADNEQSEAFISARDYSIELHLWLNDKASIKETQDDMYNDIILNIGDMMNGNYSESRQFIEDNRTMFDDLRDEDGNFLEGVEESLDRFEERVNELELNYRKEDREHRLPIAQGSKRKRQ